MQSSAALVEQYIRAKSAGRYSEAAAIARILDDQVRLETRRAELLGKLDHAERKRNWAEAAEIHEELVSVERGFETVASNYALPKEIPDTPRSTRTLSVHSLESNSGRSEEAPQPITASRSALEELIYQARQDLSQPVQNHTTTQRTSQNPFL